MSSITWLLNWHLRYKSFYSIIKKVSYMLFLWNHKFMYGTIAGKSSLNLFDIINFYARYLYNFTTLSRLTFGHGSRSNISDRHDIRCTQLVRFRGPTDRFSYSICRSLPFEMESSTTELHFHDDDTLKS